MRDARDASSRRPAVAETMVALVYRGPGVLRLEALPLPPLGPGDVLVRVRAASLCGTDLKILAHGHPRIPEGTARVLGHEFAGEVVATTTAAVAEGTRVGVVPDAGCGACRECHAGLDALCPRAEALGITIDGGLAAYVRIPARAVARGHLIPLPPELSFDEAALLEPLSCVLHAHQAIGTARGDGVLVLGAGPMGLMHVAVARHLGAHPVLVSDPWPGRRARAEALGAAAVPPEHLQEALGRLTDGRGFDVVVVTAPRAEAVETALASAAPRGRINLFAALPRGAGPPPFPVNLIHYRRLVVTGTTGSSVVHYRSALELVQQGALDLGAFITRRAGFGEVETVLERIRARDEVKVVLRPHEGSGAVWNGCSC